MRLTVLDSASEVGVALADRIADLVRRHPAPVIGLPTGQTPLAAYDELKRRYAAGAVDLSTVSTFNLDEFAGIPPDHAGSFRQFMQRHLFAGVNVPPVRIHFLRGDAPDFEAECLRYEAEIQAAGGIDLQVLGIGANGHIGFNEPADALIAQTHVATLLDSTRRDNASLFGGDPRRVPERALTAGMGTILRSRRIILAATGSPKAGCIGELVRGGVTPRLPASFLQLHGDVELLLDTAAASRL